MVAEVRDDPDARIRLAADTYALCGVGRPYRPYRRAVVAFMRWQQERGVLNALDSDAPGSPWWRAVNEDLLRDTLEAKLLVEREEGVPSRPNVQRWVDFFRAPSARSWYLAHNASVVGGYLEHRWLAEFETLAERFFMNVILVRVLFAHALVLDADLALGRLAFLGRMFGHPRARGPQTLLAMKNVLPDAYPITDIEDRGPRRRREPVGSNAGLWRDQCADRGTVCGVRAGPRRAATAGPRARRCTGV